MIKILFGIFFVLHGFVHLLYYGQSARHFELQPGMVWPDGSWAFSKFLGEEAARNLASALLILAAIGFVMGGVGLFAQQVWWRPVIVGTAIFSSALFILFWDGVVQALPNKGGVGILINFAILIVVLVFNLPSIE